MRPVWVSSLPCPFAVPRKNYFMALCPLSLPHCLSIASTCVSIAIHCQNKLAIAIAPYSMNAQVSQQWQLYACISMRLNIVNSKKNTSVTCHVLLSTPNSRARYGAVPKDVKTGGLNNVSRSCCLASVRLSSVYHEGEQGGL